MKVFNGTTMARSDAERLAARMKALADPVRLQILALPKLAEASVTELAAVVGLSQPTMTHHLQVLVRAGFVTREKRGRQLFHELNRARLAEVSDALRGAR